MSAIRLIERLLQREPWSGSRRTTAQSALPPTPHGAAEAIVAVLLGDAPVCEASVHRPQRGSVWVATFTGPTGGQVWKSTGLTDKEQALLVAKRWEADARAQRARLGQVAKRPTVRVRRPANSPRTYPLTQKEVAQFLRMSERGVREVERRAFRKIRNHPVLRQLWQQYLAGELDERQLLLTPDEIEALFNLVGTPEERALLHRVVRFIQA